MMKLIKINIIWIFIFVLNITSIYGVVYNLNNIPNPKAIDSRTHVSNPDGIINFNTVQTINQKLSSLETQNQIEVAVVLVNSIGTENIEMFATDLFKKWGIGKAKDNNGLLILFVGDQKAIRFETGYGLEGVLPDALASRVQNQSMFPYFKNGDYDTGFIKGIDHLITILEKEEFEKEQSTIAWSTVLPIVAGIYVIILLISFVLTNSSIKKIKNNAVLRTNISKYIAIKNNKRGVISLINITSIAIGVFVILMFSNPVFLVFLVGIPIMTYPANLYAKIIMWRIRRQPIPCTACEGKMHILSEKKEDAYLKVSQQFEEELGTVDYDVFVCKDCGNEAVFTLDKPSAYSECPQCKTKAFSLHSKKVIVAPTFINSGTERVTYKCKFCGYEENDNHQLPKISRNSSIAAGAAAGSVFSGRGGFGGGGGFSGGSFGGGLSGGGGATGRW
ncbi:MAG: hypothetical protein BGO29_10290 [Bacteroidales bacterium 36-12]|nr:MAG: hypothetical protein BGO29_10290 [Bacteroidales bacterium 36-12]